MKWFYIISLIVVAAMVACPFWLLPGADAGHLTQVVDRYDENHEPVYKDHPIVGYDSYGIAVRSIDSTTCGDTTSSGIQGNIYEGLYGYHYLIRPPKIIPLLAEALPEVSEDRKTYTIRLKKDVKFQRNPCFGVWPNGTPKTRTVTADDFILGFKRCADFHNSKVSLGWAFLSGRIVGLDEFRDKTRLAGKGDFNRYDLPVEGLRALDDHTLQIRLTEPFPQFIYVLAMSVYAPCPREAINYWLATEPADDGDGRVPIPEGRRAVEFTEQPMVIGTGPYLLKEFKRKQRILLVRNPDFRKDYYPTEGMPEDRAAGLLVDAGKRVPFIDAYQYDFVAENFAAWRLFLSRQTGASGIPRQQFEDVITPGKELTDRWRKRGIYLVTYTSPAVYWYAFNMDDALLGQSKALRQAMCLCFDVDSQIKILYNGRGKWAKTIIPSSFDGYTQAGPGPYWQLDVERAKKKIAEARQELATKGLLNANGEIPPITIDYGDRGEGTQRMAEFAKQQFARVGLEIKPVFNDWPTLQEKVHNKAVQVYTMGWHADYPDAENFLQLFYSQNIPKGTNNTNYKNAEFDKLYEAARVMPDSPERMALYVKMIRMVAEDVPVLLLSEPLSFVLYSDWNKNIKRHPIGYGFLKYRRIDLPLREEMGGPN